MKITIKEYCIRCGLCQDLYPELFKYNHTDDKIDVNYDVISEILIAESRSAAADCAVTATFLK